MQVEHQGTDPQQVDDHAFLLQCLDNRWRKHFRFATRPRAKPQWAPARKHQVTALSWSDAHPLPNAIHEVTETSYFRPLEPLQGKRYL